MDLVRKSHWTLWIIFVLVSSESATVELQSGLGGQTPPAVRDGSRLANASSAERAVAKAANRLAKKFTEASVEELGLTALDEIIASLRAGPRLAADDDLLEAMAAKLSRKLAAAARSLEEMRRGIEDDPAARSFTHPCPLDSIENGEQMSLGKIELPTRMDGNEEVKVKRQYFMSVADGATDRLCGRVTSRASSRRLFHHTLQPQPKQILLILATARASRPELRLAFSVARELLALLTPSDSVGLLLVGSDRESVRLTAECDGRTPYMGPATDRNREHLMKYLSGAEIEDNRSDSGDAIQEGLNAFSTIPYLENPMIVYIGVEPPTFDEIARNVTSTELHRKVFYSTCDVSLGGTGNNSENLNPLGSHSSHVFWEGAVVRCESPASAGWAASMVLLTLPLDPTEDGPMASPPEWDVTQRDLLVALALPCGTRGILAVELYASDLAEDVVYFTPLGSERRAFIVDLEGRVVMHSVYSRPEIVISRPRLVDISLLETPPEFSRIRTNMLRDSAGTMSLRIEEIEMVYSWRRVERLYVLCLVSEIGKGETLRGARGSSVASSAPRDLQFHRIDLLPPSDSPLCRHFKQVSTIERGTLFLGPSGFRSPFRYLFDIRNGRDVSSAALQRYMAYLKDETRLLSNPGLKPEVRDDVSILHPMLSYFRRQHIHGAYNKYIVRRYAATEHGVLVMFPGSVLESDFEPNRKAWFTRALRNPGKVVLTPPYLDAGGAGYIVSVSHAVLDPADNFRPTLVVSMDMTMGFLYKMLLESLMPCSDSDVKCFLMDDRGYLLAHPGLLDPGSSGPIEQQHVTHKESLIANDMLNHRGFVQKKLCKNYGDGTIQRFYVFNDSVGSVLTNLVHGEHCARYHITAIPGTNAFVGMVNSSCNLGAFCPCSVVDRLCLNCNRMEQSECECPCECTLPDTPVCPSNSGTASSPSLGAPLCEPQPERNDRGNRFFYNLANRLKPCFDFRCESYAGRSACLGVLGCEWCQLDADGESSLATPFCSAQAACFGGVLGALTPYGEGSPGRVAQDDLLAAYSSVGPIAGCAVALCLVLAAAVYCYRQNSTAPGDPDAFAATSPETWPEPGIGPTPPASEDDVRDERSGHRDKLLAVEPAAPVSPYRILTGYRRPDTAGESDHGYSTMTPHDDSEPPGLALVEPFLSGAGGSPEAVQRASPDLPLTLLPCGKNNVLAPVTVHRHMEAT